LGATRGGPEAAPWVKWEDAVDDPLGTDTYALGINNKGDVVGANSSPGGEEGFVYSDGKYTTIRDPLGIVSGESRLSIHAWRRIHLRRARPRRPRRA
jgi:probable HAF family extracellular repeat protein